MGLFMPRQLCARQPAKAIPGCWEAVTLGRDDGVVF